MTYLWIVILLTIILKPFSVFGTMDKLMLKDCYSFIGPQGICPQYSRCYKKLTKLLYGKHCRDYFEESPKCKKGCRNRLKKILKKFPGVEKALKGCKCKQYECITAKERIFRCIDDIPPKGFDSFTHVKKICLAGEESKNCKKLYMDRFNNCHDLYNDGTCKAKCKGASEKLIQDNIGKHFQDAVCDGTWDNEKFCREVGDLRKKLCYD